MTALLEGLGFAGVITGAGVEGIRGIRGLSSFLTGGGQADPFPGISVNFI